MYAYPGRAECHAAGCRLAGPVTGPPRSRSRWVIAAAGKGHEWIVTGFTGTVLESYRYISAGGFSASAVRHEITSAAS